MLTRDLHLAKETVDSALYNLKESISLAKRQKEHIICFIVGYGSTGKTHKIQTAVMEVLEEYQKKNFIKEFIRGNHIDIFNEEYQKMKFKDRIPKEEHQRKNPGAVYVIL